MEMLPLAEAWRWVQIGFCASVGASVILLGAALVLNPSVPIPPHPEDPHCSRCCPNVDDDEGGIG